MLPLCHEQLMPFQSMIGVDAGTGYVHSLTGTAANVHDITEASKLLRSDDEVVYGDAGYLGIEKREEIKNDENKSKIAYRINRRAGVLRKDPMNTSNQWERHIESRKSSVRCKVEHVFRTVKIQFGFGKVLHRHLKESICRF